MRQSLIVYFKQLYERRLWVLAVVFVAYAGIAAYDIATKSRQHDFTTYYFAAKAYTQGSNPYDLSVLSSIANERIKFPFLYPPISLYFFSVLSLVEYEVAYHVFLLLKVLALAGLVILWAKYFCETERERTLMFLFSTIAFNQTVIRDLATGNISLFEQVFFWLAFLSLLKERYTLFALLIFIGTLFKPLALLMLLPLALVLKKNAIRPLLLVVLLFGLAHGLSAVVESDLVREFLNRAHLPHDGLVSNPSSLEIMRVTAHHYPLLQNIFGSDTYVIMYGVFVSIVLGMSFFVLPKLDAKAGIMCALFVYALIAPRFKVYSYILLIVPVMFTVANLIRTTAGRIIAVSFSCTSLAVYQPFVVAMSFFGVFVYDSVMKRKCARARTGDSQPVGRD